MEAGQCGNQMGTKFWEVVCDGHGIGGGGKYCGGNNAQFGRINVLYHKATAGKYDHRAVLSDLEPGVIHAATISRRSASFSALKTSRTHKSVPKSMRVMLLCLWGL
jgi:hypothetical protein